MATTAPTGDLSWTPSPPQDTFGYRLYLLRSELDLTLKEIAALCRVPANTWSNWEQGHSPRKLTEVVSKIVLATGVNRDWLLWGGSTSARMYAPLALAPPISGRRYISPPGNPLLSVVKDERNLT